MRETYGLEIYEVTREWSKLHIEELNDCTHRHILEKSNQIARHVARIQKRNAYKIVVWKSEEKRTLARLNRRWEIILKWILKK
jgi:hypothetical protein